MEYKVRDGWVKDGWEIQTKRDDEELVWNCEQHKGEF